MEKQARIASISWKLTSFEVTYFSQCSTNLVISYRMCCAFSLGNPNRADKLSAFSKVASRPLLPNDMESENSVLIPCRAGVGTIS